MVITDWTYTDCASLSTLYATTKEEHGGACVWRQGDHYEVTPQGENLGPDWEPVEMKWDGAMYYPLKSTWHE